MFKCFGAHGRLKGVKNTVSAEQPVAWEAPDPKPSFLLVDRAEGRNEAVSRVPPSGSGPF